IAFSERLPRKSSTTPTVRSSWFDSDRAEWVRFERDARRSHKSRSSRDGARFHQTVFVESVLDGAYADVEQLGRLHGRAVRRLERLQDRVTLDLRHRRARNADATECLARAFEREIPFSDGGTLAEHHGPLDSVLECAHVPRPPVGDQLCARLVAESVDALVVL